MMHVWKFSFDEEYQNVTETENHEDGRQDGGHMIPMGHDLILGPPKFLN